MRDWNERNGKVSEVSRESRSRESKLARFPTFALKTRSSWERGLFFAQKFAEKPQRVKKKRRVSRAREKRPAVKRALSSATRIPFPLLLEKRERERMCEKRETERTMVTEVISWVLEWGAEAKKRARERREKNKKNLIYENEWKKAKTTPKSELMESTWKKKKGEQTKGELNSLTFQTHLSFTLYTHTHTTKKHFKSCPNLCKLLAECVFIIVFFSLRIVTLTGTRRAILFFLEKMV